MGYGQWGFLVVFQACSTLINLMLFNNLFDRTLIFEIACTVATFVGLISAMYNEKDIKESSGTAIVINIIFTMFYFRLFLYI